MPLAYIKVLSVESMGIVIRYLRCTVLQGAPRRVRCNRLPNYEPTMDSSKRSALAARRRSATVPCPVLNDVHSRRNASRPALHRCPISLEEVRAALFQARRRGLTVAIAGGRHAMGGQQFIDGGCVIDVRANRVIAGGMSMPHSPRIYNGRLYLHNSGTGQFGWLDPTRGSFEPICFCPGYLRGLAFSRGYAIVGLSKPRDSAFNGLALNDELVARGATAQCGLRVVDLQSGDIVHWLKFEGNVGELYDVVALPATGRPKSIGFKTDEIQRTIVMDSPGSL